MASSGCASEAYRERVTGFHLAAIVQNLKTLALRLIRPSAKARLRVSCVELVGGVSVRQMSALAKTEKT
jgi:hypothetical protein